MAHLRSRDLDRHSSAITPQKRPLESDNGFSLQFLKPGPECAALLWQISIYDRHAAEFQRSALHKLQACGICGDILAVAIHDKDRIGRKIDQIAILFFTLEEQSLLRQAKFGDILQCDNAGN